MAKEGFLGALDSIWSQVYFLDTAMLGATNLTGVRSSRVFLVTGHSKAEQWRISPRAPFNRTSLIKHLVEAAALEVRAVKAMMATLEATIFASVHKKGLGSFTLPGL